jgi:hypothetical protein
MEQDINFESKTTTKYVKKMIKGLLEFDPEKRWSADMALKYSLFRVPNTMLKNKMEQRLNQDKLFNFSQRKLQKVNLIKRGVLVLIAIRVVAKSLLD